MTTKTNHVITRTVTTVSPSIQWNPSPVNDEFGPTPVTQFSNDPSKNSINDINPNTTKTRKGLRFRSHGSRNNEKLSLRKRKSTLPKRRQLRPVQLRDKIQPLFTVKDDIANGKVGKQIRTIPLTMNHGNLNFTAHKEENSKHLAAKNPSLVSSVTLSSGQTVGRKTPTVYTSLSPSYSLHPFGASSQWLILKVREAHHSMRPDQHKTVDIQSGSSTAIEHDPIFLQPPNGFISTTVTHNAPINVQEIAPPGWHATTIIPYHTLPNIATHVGNNHPLDAKSHNAPCSPSKSLPPNTSSAHTIPCHGHNFDHPLKPFKPFSTVMTFLVAEPELSTAAPTPSTLPKTDLKSKSKMNNDILPRSSLTLTTNWDGTIQAPLLDDHGPPQTPHQYAAAIQTPTPDALNENASIQLKPVHTLAQGQSHDNARPLHQTRPSFTFKRHSQQK